MDVPSAGVVAIEALQILEHFDPDAMTPAQWAAVEGQALAIASGELDRMGTDTAAARATSKAWAKARWRSASGRPGTRATWSSAQALTPVPPSPTTRDTPPT